MRTFWRVILPLLLGLALLAWGASAVVNTATRAWFARDITLRARLAVGAAQGTLASSLEAGNKRRLEALLDELSRDERIMGAEVCTTGLSTVARTRAFPQQFSCETLRRRLPDARSESEPLTFDDEIAGGPVHVGLYRIHDEDGARGAIVLVHDLSFVTRREAAMRRFTAGAFALVALLASILTYIARRAWFRSWTDELRRLLLVPLGGRPADARRGPEAFQPLLADVRQLVANLSSEHVSAVRPWSPDRLHQVLRETLHGESVVLVANREPYIHDFAPDGTVRVQHPASGLVSALEPVMRACSGTWIAHGSGTADRRTVDRRDHIRVPPGEESYAIRRVWLTKEEERGYYYGFSNEGLWPLCHVAHTRPEFRAADWREYERVNQRFADAVCEEVDGPDPIVLVQDYHFALAPRMIRERLPRATIITFWHIPWPNAERLGICPWERELLAGLLGSSIVGFHTQQHCNNFIESVDRFLESRIDRERQAVVQAGRECLVRSYPISIDWPNRWAQAAAPATECRRTVFAELGLAPDALLGVGVDRLDYTKGIEERLLAVERALERFPDLRGRFTFAQLAAPSRTLIDKYRELNERVESLAARINERFASGTYRPIALLRAHHEPPAIFRFLRAADVCYVSSLDDGMNLVAKEFVAARDDERGVLVLSRFTGAARELTEALIVNPYDLEQASAALATALAMPPQQQAERMRAMRGLVAEFNVYRWAGRMLSDAARVRQRGRLSDRLSIGLRAIDGTGP
ncbi:MAG TPA: trehalose-6-phosphate synthase [Anaeromyxobacteraceae bacterium]|nr:trehalose-6-phosphate synthase [Anaeromyxobacteraceae bacterium]